MSDEHDIWLSKVERALESFRAHAEETVTRGGASESDRPSGEHDDADDATS